MKKHFKNLKTTIYTLWLSFSYKVLLPINNLVCANQLVFYFVLQVRFSNLLVKLQDNYKKNKIIAKKEDILTAISKVYFTTPRKKRTFIKNYIIGSFYVPEASHKMVKSQGRNEKCNCGSGLKFKKCCLKKY